MNEKNKNKIQKALLDKALGFTTQEITEEYGYTGEEFVLQKRKTCTKSYPPDLAALQMLMEKSGGGEFEKYSTEDLEKEKLRLIELLKEKK